MNIMGFNELMKQVDDGLPNFFACLVSARTALCANKPDGCAKVLLQTLKKSKADIDSMVLAIKPKILNYYACITDEIGMVEICNVLISQTSFEYVFKDRKKINIEPLVMVLEICRIWLNKKGVDLGSVLLTGS